MTKKPRKTNRRARRKPERTFAKPSAAPSRKWSIGRGVVLVGGAATIIASALLGALICYAMLETSDIRKVAIRETALVYCNGPGESPDRYLGATALGARIVARSGLGAILWAEIQKCKFEKR